MKKIILICFLFFYISSFGKKLINIPLLESEKKWIKTIQNEEIRIYLQNDLGVLNYSTKSQNNGIYPEMIKILEDSTGLSFQIIKKSDDDFKEKIDLGIPDIVMGVEDSKINRKRYYYLEDSIKLNGVFLTRRDHPIIDSNTDISGKTIVYVKGDKVIDKIKKIYGSRVSFIFKANPDKAMESLLSGEADIYAEDLEESLKYMVGDYTSKFKINYLSNSLKTNYYIGGLYKYKGLIDIIGRIVETFDLNDRAIYEGVLDYTRDNIETSREIRNFIKNNKTLKVFIPKGISAYPIYYRDDLNNQNGFILNYFYEIEQIFGIKMVFEESDSLEGFDINPCIESIDGISINDDGFLTTDPYMEFQFYVFNREESNYISNLESLKKYKIAVKKGNLEEIYLLKKGFEKNMILFETEREVIQSINKGEADVVLGGIRKVDYLLKKYDIKGLKVAGIIPDKISLKFGVPKENELLYFLINSYTKDFSASIESRKNKFLEKKIEVTKDLRISMIIVLFSALGFGAVYLHLKKLKKLYSKLSNITLGMVEVLENANTYNDEDTGDHVKRISRYSKIIAYEMNMSKQFIKEVEVYASLHDIGKIGISDAILKKPGKLTNEEFDIIKTHVEIGFNIIKDLDVSKVALNIIRYHHEKWDGSGYGKGLKGKKIPIEARIVALADVYDALRQKRVYKDAFSHEKSMQIITSESGKHFDPEIVDIFIKKEKDFKKIFENQKLK